MKKLHGCSSYIYSKFYQKSCFSARCVIEYGPTRLVYSYKR